MLYFLVLIVSFYYRPIYSLEQPNRTLVMNGIEVTVPEKVTEFYVGSELIKSTIGTMDFVWIDGPWIKWCNKTNKIIESVAIPQFTQKTKTDKVEDEWVEVSPQSSSPTLTGLAYYVSKISPSKKS